MAQRLQIEVVIAPDGTVTLTTHGLKGATCVTELATLEKAVGKVLTREKTREYYEQATVVSTKTSGKAR